MEKLRILLADDHAVILDGLNAMLEGEDDLEVIDGVQSGEEVMQKLEFPPHPDLIILDINMPDMDGIEVTEAVKKDFPDIKILILSMHSRTEFINKLLAAGADGYILKNSGRDELLTAIRVIANGDQFFSREIIKKGFTDQLLGNTGVVELSDREKDVIRYIAEGLSSREIAEELNISSHTVDSHRKNVLTKIGARNTADITRYAIQTGIVKGFDMI